MGWIKRHWLTLLSAVPFVPTLFKAAKGLVGLGGDADFIISRTEDPGWLRPVLIFLTDPPGWAIIPMISAGLGLIWWDARRGRSAGVSSGQAPASAPSRREPSFGRAFARWTREAAVLPARPAASENVASVLSPRSVSAASAPEPEWEKLYEITADGQHVWLRFLPDTEHVERDALLLIVLGYKVMKLQDRVPVGIVHNEALRAYMDAPNSPVPNGLKPLYLWKAPGGAEKLGKTHINAGNLVRVGLAEGGAYQLTAKGEETAKMDARDLIRRA